MEYELAIIGGGPAGYTAGIYAVRSGIKTVVIEKAMGGGLANISHKIENYPGFESISGMDLCCPVLLLFEKGEFEFGLLHSEWF